MVTDASLWVSYFLPKDRWHQESRAWLNDRLAEGTRLVAPELLLAEVGGAVARMTGEPDLGRRAVSWLLARPHLEIVSEEAPGVEAARLACALRLRGADAYYVLTAQRRSLPLVSWDDDQRTKARVVVPVGRPSELP